MEQQSIPKQESIPQFDSQAITDIEAGVKAVEYRKSEEKIRQQ